MPAGAASDRDHEVAPASGNPSFHSTQQHHLPNGERQVDALVTFDVQRAMLLAADGRTCTLRLVDGTSLAGSVVADTASMLLRITVSSVVWLVPVGNVVALTAA
jgi:hypothetical protein